MPIKKLSKETIEQISAGEVITDSLHIIKELVENSIDAGAKNIFIEIKNKNLKITDDGRGIEKEDFKMLCERYCTSKLFKAEDMSDISTFGFRGEALASISILSKVQVKSRRSDSPTGYHATYKLNRLDRLDSVSMKCGTEIFVNEIFSGCENRKSLDFNKNKIFRLLIAFQAVNLNVQFSLLFNNQIIPIQKTNSRAEILTKNYNLNCNLHELKMHNFHAHFSPTTTSFQKIIFICFINNRLVQQNSLRKKLKELYSQFLMKNQHPFIFLNIFLDRKSVDVNVHPSKDDVLFLNEETLSAEIISNIKIELEIADSKIFTYSQKSVPNEKPSANFKVYDEVKLSLDYYSKENKEVKKNSIEKNNFDFHSLTELKLENKKIQEKLDFVFIGIFNGEIAMYQKNNMLYECAYRKLYADLFYEILLENFGNYPYLEVDYTFTGEIENEKMLAMVDDYFNIKIMQSKIKKIPVFFNIIFNAHETNLLVENIFLLDFKEEKSTFFNILKILSDNYARKVYAHDKILNDCINIGIRVTDKIYSHFKPVIGGEELFRLFKR